MLHLLRVVRLALPAMLLATLPLRGQGRADDTLFESKVRPLLAGTCFRCHGGERTAGKLRVDSREALLKGGSSGPALAPGDPDGSLLIRALRHADDVAAMPPGKPLDAALVRDVAAWVKAGAPWPASRTAPFTAARHWAFQPFRAHVPPAAAGPADNPIDRFLNARLRDSGLTPAGPADRRTLLRRAAFDLTGLPPTPEEMDAFLADPSPAAFARAVDRLLASPRYGEKWGRLWLDVVRYADTAGETADIPVPEAWRYRNYVFAAFNADKPFDLFLREQLAGDVLAARLPPGSSPDRYAELVTATGYLAIARRFGFDIVQDHHLTLDDTLDTLGKSVLGLALGCARCHDHKYDPVSTADYYALYGIFASTRYPFSGCEKDRAPRDLAPLAPPGQPKGAVAYAVAEGKPADARIQLRGDPKTLGEAVPRRFLSVLGGQPVPPDGGSGRLALAVWLTDSANPLTARVIANRVWQGHFGHGLVRTPNDFGTRGEPPTHPELLDTLAARLVESGWSLKALHRLVMLSAGYQRAGQPEAARQADPANLLLAGFPRRRLTAEEIRDAMLAVAGDLDASPGGPHPFPPANTWQFTQHTPFTAVYDHNRRSAYLMIQRIKRHPFLALFDAADAGASTAARHSTTVPTQALFFLNDPFVHARADALAARLQPLPDEAARLDRACRLCFGRAATPEEHRAAEAFLTDYAAALGLPEPQARQARQAARAAWLRVLLGTNEFCYVD